MTDSENIDGTDEEKIKWVKEHRIQRLKTLKI